MDRTRGVSFSSLGERRSWWLGFVGQACVYAASRRANPEQPADRMERAMFAHALSVAKGTGLPLSYASAQALRQALEAAALGLTQAERAAEVEILAALTEAAARGLDQLMQQDAVAQAEVWRGRMGETRDD